MPPRIFPPEKKEVPEGYAKNGQGSSWVKSCWGVVEVRVQRLKGRDGKQSQMYQDACLDESGWSPEALGRLLDTAARLPFEEAAHLANRFGLTVSSSGLERLAQPYTAQCREVVSQVLSSTAQRMRGSAEIEPRPSRLMVLQLDGVYVLGRPEAGGCSGVEIKTAVLYPQASPGERWMLADVVGAEAFLASVAGLLARAGVTAQDTLLGLGDGASWIETIFDTLAAVRITDVFHSCAYLDIIMQALGWQEDERAFHRRCWCRGDVGARDWLQTHLPEPQVWLAWDDEAKGALRYLENRLDNMDYLAFRNKAWPIGSGQIEAMNKSVIGHRMKRSGMHWSRSGAAGMAALRAQVCAKHPLVDFHSLRQQAFPPPLPLAA